MGKEIIGKFKLAGLLILAGVILLAGSAFLEAKFGQKTQEKLILQGDLANTASTANTGKVEINGSIVEVEVVDTPLAMERGLGSREELPPGGGMWFVFPFGGRNGIWMKDMKFPIDIIWFDKNLKVVGIKENALPESYPEIFYPKENSLYVLEISAGFAANKKIKIYDQAKIFLGDHPKD